MPGKITVWRIMDGKRGHENQTGGLADALARLRPIDPIQLPVGQFGVGWMAAFLGRFPASREFAKPDLIIGAGSATHASLIAAGRATGAPTVLLMSPPRGLTWCFDLCVVPQHDNRPGPNVLTTRGALNRIRPSQKQDPNAGLFLIGGPSAHHGWASPEILRQLETIVDAEPGIHWTLTTSRRTPEATTKAIEDLRHPRLKVVPFAQTGEAWLPEQISRSARVWVSEDSVSMVYDALSSGASVGILDVPRKNETSRVIRGIDELKKDHLVTTLGDSPSKPTTQADRPTLAEADRIAAIINERFFPPANPS